MVSILKRGDEYQITCPFCKQEFKGKTKQQVKIKFGFHQLNCTNEKMSSVQ